MADFSKYQRQTTLKSFGLDKQQKLANSRALIVGMGGLGIPAAQYLNAMGVGQLGLMDQDSIAAHNLQRQVLYAMDEVGQSKVLVAAKKLAQQNPDTVIKPMSAFLNKDNALQIIKDYDVVIDATDNFSTRYLINDACVILKKPFVYGALHAFEGQVSVFNYNNGPTYRCLFPKRPQAEEIPNCNDNGVLGVIPAIIGSLQALEAVKVLTGLGEPLAGKLLIYDGLTQQNRLIQFKAVPAQQNIKALATDYGDDLCQLAPTITAAAFLALKGNLQLIDVRSVAEFAEHSLKNAINIPLDALAQQYHKINFNKPLYLLCQSGKRSTIAAQKLLQEQPEAQVFSITGGMDQITALWP